MVQPVPDSGFYRVYQVSKYWVFQKTQTEFTGLTPDPGRVSKHYPLLKSLDCELHFLYLSSSLKGNTKGVIGSCCRCCPQPYLFPQHQIQSNQALNFFLKPQLLKYPTAVQVLCRAKYPKQFFSASIKFYSNKI